MTPHVAKRALFTALALYMPLAMEVLGQEAAKASGTGNVQAATTTQTAEGTDARTNRGGAAISAPAEKKHPVLQLFRDFKEDQEGLWTSPARLRFRDAAWLVPLSGFTAGLFVTDADVTRHLSHNPKTLSHYETASSAGVLALVGGAGGMWVLSHYNHDEHWRETGFLAGEAAVSSLVMTETLKYSFRRQRPFQGDGTGPFFRPGGTSFPSEHSAAAWSVASVIAHEYPGPLTKILAYGAAALVSYSRVRAEKHFPSDVAIGALLGELAAYQVYKRRHDPELDGDVWSDPADTLFDESHPKAGSMGSPYVPLDSWVYPVFQRLLALGYLDSAMLGQRPWTRRECARLLAEASQSADERGAASPEASQLLESLRKEFAPNERVPEEGDNRSVQLESVYTRMTGISGQPLRDAYHFGETLTNDYGRPYEEGVNNVTGMSGWATAGPWVAYVRGEYQYAPSGPAYSAAARNFIAQVDENPVQPASPSPVRDQFRLLDAYVGLSLHNWQMTYGQQSLWWGPGRMGPLLLSNNAAPMRMIQLNRVTPFTLPWVFRYLGPVRMDAFFGNLQGHEFPPHPFMHGEKISFKPTPNLEFGFSKTDILGGVGRPLIFASLFNSYFSVTSSSVENPATDPGKRTGGFDFSYRVPFVRNWLTVYADSIATDDPSPLAAPRRAGINPGIYMPQLPGLRKLDLRVEAAYTDTPSMGTPAGHFIYFDGFYHDLYTNRGQLLGDAVGRDGKGIQAWSRYWIGARNSIELGYRHGTVSGKFVPGGGSINDGSVDVNVLLHRDWSVSASVQVERWNFPILAGAPQTNVVSSLGITFLPQKR